MIYVIRDNIFRRHYLIYFAVPASDASRLPFLLCRQRGRRYGKNPARRAWICRRIHDCICNTRRPGRNSRKLFKGPPDGSQYCFRTGRDIFRALLPRPFPLQPVPWRRENSTHPEFRILLIHAVRRRIFHRMDSVRGSFSRFCPYACIPAGACA